MVESGSNDTRRADRPWLAAFSMDLPAAFIPNARVEPNQRVHDARVAPGPHPGRLGGARGPAGTRLQAGPHGIRSSESELASPERSRARDRSMI